VTFPRVALQEVAQIVGGGRMKLSGNDFLDEGFPAYGAGGMNGRLAVAEFDRSAVILSAIGARCGKCFLAEGRWASLANTQLIFPDESRVDVRFLWYQLNDEARWPRAGVAQPFIRPSDVKAHLVILPPLEQQKRIAAILDQVDALRRLRARTLDHLNALGQAIFHEMFGDVRSNVKEFPILEFGDFAEVKLGKMLDRGKSKGGDQFPYLRNANVRWFGFDLSDLSMMEFSPSEFARFSVRAGDLLICEGGEPGRCAVWRDESREIFYQKALHRARLDTEKALPEYIAQWFAAAAAVGAFDEAVTVATISHLTGEKIKALKIMLPPLADQQAFINKLKSVGSSASLAAYHSDRTNALFTSLRQRAFWGEL